MSVAVVSGTYMEPSPNIKFSERWKIFCKSCLLRIKVTNKSFSDSYYLTGFLLLFLVRLVLRYCLSCSSCWEDVKYCGTLFFRSYRKTCSYRNTATKHNNIYQGLQYAKSKFAIRLLLVVNA